MTENLTRQHNLVREITNQGWFSNPAGKQGYDVILLEKVGNGGTRFYHLLKPGETLRLAERLLSSYIALEVDMRHARAFPVSGSFNTRDRGRKVSLELNIRYHVADSRIVAMETVDPLGELQSKVISILNRDLQGYFERDITVSVIERIVQGIGQVPHLGLTVEDVEVMTFASDSRMTGQVVEEEDVQHSISIEAVRRRADIASRSELEDASIENKTKRYAAINLSNLNVLLHEYPNLLPQVLETFSRREQTILEAKIGTVQNSIQAYIAQQIDSNGEVDPREIGNILRDAISNAPAQLQGSSDLPQISWGDEPVIPEESKDINVPDAKEVKENKSKPVKKSPRITFGEE